MSADCDLSFMKKVYHVLNFITAGSRKRTPLSKTVFKYFFHSVNKAFLYVKFNSRIDAKMGNIYDKRKINTYVKVIYLI